MKQLLWTIQTEDAFKEFERTGILRANEDYLFCEDYYRFAYPSNIIVSAGVHFQLTKRSGMTKKELKNKARSIVYENQ